MPLDGLVGSLIHRGERRLILVRELNDDPFDMEGILAGGDLLPKGIENKDRHLNLSDSIRSYSTDGSATMALVNAEPISAGSPRIWCALANYHQDDSKIGQSVKYSPIVIPVLGSPTGPGDPMGLPQADPNFNYAEPELTIIIGRDFNPTREHPTLSREEALQYVAGYAAGNDYTSAGIAKMFKNGETPDDRKGRGGPTIGESKCFKGFKSINAFMNMSISPDGLPISLTIDGEEKGPWNTRYMSNSVANLVSHVSRYGFKRGDMIYTGAPSPNMVDKAIENGPAGNFLVPGNNVFVYIKGLGPALYNPIKATPKV